MSRNKSGVILKVIAGLFLIDVGISGFLNDPSPGEKSTGLFLFSALAVAALWGGLALTGFRNWKRDVGIVFLGAAAYMAIMVPFVVSIFMTKNLRDLIPPELLTFFGDYLTGGAIIVGYAVVGWIFFKAGKGAA